VFRIREVDADDDEIADTLKELHLLTFVDDSPIPDLSVGHWWIAYQDSTPVAFAGLQKSTHERGAGYFNRVGVLHGFRGFGLQRRLTRCLEMKAWRSGWERIVSDTTDNLPSANNFIACGYFMFQPQWPWSFPNAIYWQKFL